MERTVELSGKIATLVIGIIAVVSFGIASWAYPIKDYMTAEQNLPWFCGTWVLSVFVLLILFSLLTALMEELNRRRIRRLRGQT